MTDPILHKLLEAAVLAPSGDNSQPWEFSLHDQIIDVYNLPDKDNPILNFEQSGSYIAHGALVENISIAAKAFGYNLEISIFPEASDPTHTARIILGDKIPNNHGLYDFLKKRCTNRKPYETKPLSDSEKQSLLSCAESPAANIFLAEDLNDKAALGQASSATEQIVLGNKNLHHLFYENIRWTDEDELNYKSGLYARTMELAPPQFAVFKLMSRWKIAKILKALGMPKFIAKENSKIYAKSAAIGMIAMQGNKREDYILAGRLMQRLWLTATSLNLSFQPIGAVLFLYRKLLSTPTGWLSEEDGELVKRAHRSISSVFKDSNNQVMMFRVGHDGEPSGRSSRKPPVLRT